MVNGEGRQNVGNYFDFIKLELNIYIELALIAKKKNQHRSDGEADWYKRGVI